MKMRQSESGAISTFGRRLSLSLRVTVDNVDELEESWAELRSRMAEWRGKRADRGHDVTVWYEVQPHLAPAAKAVLAQHLLCCEEQEFAGIKVHAFVVDPNHTFYCEIGLPNLD